MREPFRISSYGNLLHWKNDEVERRSQESSKGGKTLNKYYFSALSKKTVGRKQFLFTKADSTMKTE